MVNGVPQPALVGLVAYIRPLLIYLNLESGFQADFQTAVCAEFSELGMNL